MEASEEKDAGDIWVSKNFKVPPMASKAFLYNRYVVPTALKCIDEVLEKFCDKNFVPEKLDYSKPDVKGNLHETLKMGSSER